MRTTLDYLDAVAARLGGASDYRVAMTLGISPQAVCNWRKGRDTIGDDAAIKVASLLGIDPAEILLSSHAAKAKNALVREALERAAKRLSTILASLVVSVVFGGFSSFSAGPAYAAVTAEGVRLCILC